MTTIWAFWLIHLQHAVADADVCLDILGGIRTWLDLLAQGGHEHPEGGDVVVPIPAVGVPGDIGVGQDLAGVLCQQTQELIRALR